MGNKIGGSGGGSSTAPLAAHGDANQLDTATSNSEAVGHNVNNRLPSNGEDGEEPVGEVPPPMQPISSMPVKPSELTCPTGIDKVIKKKLIDH